MSQSEGEEFSSKNDDLEKESSWQGASHKCPADMEPIEKLKLVKQVLWTIENLVKNKVFDTTKFKNLSTIQDEFVCCPLHQVSSWHTNC